MKDQFTNYNLIKSIYENNCVDIPKKRGLYVVVKPTDIVAVFNKSSNAIIEFKGKSMLYDVVKLEKNFQASDQKILYIGSTKNLYTRIKQLIHYGYNGKPKHFGGRTLWQMENYGDFKLGFLQLQDPTEDPLLEKKKFLLEYFQMYGVLPVANQKI